MKKLLKRISCLILIIVLNVTLVSCGDKKDSKTSDTTASVSIEGESEVADEGINEEGILLDVLLVNDTAEDNTLWIGNSFKIDDSNIILSGDTRYDSKSINIVKSQINDNIKVNCAKDGNIISSDTLEISAEYVEGKPVLVKWDGEKFKSFY